MNSIDTTTFSYIANLTSDAQNQINALVSNLDYTSNLLQQDINLNEANFSNYLQITSNYLEQQIITNDSDILDLIKRTSNISFTDAENYTIAHNLTIQSNLTIQRNLTVNSNITFDGKLNNISSNVVNYIANLTSDVQSQIDTVVSNLDSTSNLLQQDINLNEANASNYLEVTSNYLQTLFSDNIKLIDHDVTMTSNLFVMGNITANSIDVIDTDSDVPYNTSLISYIESKIDEAIQPLLSRIQALESEHNMV